MSIRRGLAWMALSQGGTFVIQFGGSVALARLLSPYEMGIYAVAAATVGVLSAIQAFGLTGFMVREHEMGEELSTSVFTVNALLAALLSLAVVGLSTLGAVFLGDPGVGRVMLMLAILPLLGILEFLPATNLERHRNFRVIASITFLRVVTTTSVTIAAALAGFSYMSFAFGGLVSAAVGAAAFNIAGREHVRLRFGLSHWRRVTRFGLDMLAINGVNAISLRAAELLLGKMVGLSALGLYTRASNLNGMLWDNVHMVIGRVVFVDFAGLHRQGVPLRDSYLRTVEVITALLWPAFAGIAVLAAPLVFVVYGERWVGAARPLAMLSIASMVLVSITMTWEVFVISQQTRRQARFEFVRAGVGLLMFAGGCFVSLTGAAVARIGEAVFATTLYRPHLQRMTGTVGRDFIGIYLRSLALTAGAVAPAAILMAANDWSREVPIGYVLASVAAGILVWAGALAAMRHPLAEEARRPLRRARG